MSYEIRQPGNTEVSLPILASFANVWKSLFHNAWLQFLHYCTDWSWQAAPFFPPFFFFVRVNIRVHVGHWRNLEFQLVTAVTYSAVSENSRALCGKSGLTHFSERIPGRLVKPTGLISQNNVCVCVWVLVWLPLGKSHSLIPRQLSKGAQAPIDCISGLSSWLSSSLISLCSVDLHSLESPDYFDPRATQSTILCVWVESCPWDCHRNMPLGWQGGSLSCLICQLHPSLLFGHPHQEIIQMKWCK